MRDENGRLNKLLGEREEEIKIVKRRWKEDKRDLAGMIILNFSFVSFFTNKNIQEGIVQNKAVYECNVKIFIIFFEKVEVLVLTT